MNDKLGSLISKASERIRTDEADRNAEERRKEVQWLKVNAEKFETMVRTTLGPEILDALGPLTFNQGRLEPSMSFSQDNREFELKCVGLPPGLVQLVEVTQEGFSYMPQVPQFNLVHQPNAKDIFLDSLGKALRKRKAE